MYYFLIGLITGGMILSICDNLKKIGKYIMGIAALIGYYGWEYAYDSMDDIRQAGVKLCLAILAGFPVIALYYYAEYLSLKEYCAKKKYDLSGYEWLRKNTNN